jgi:hypothetical protein
MKEGGGVWTEVGFKDSLTVLCRHTQSLAKNDSIYVFAKKLRHVLE